jgi:glutathione S-transferase
MALTYYYTPLGSSTRVTWALEELGLQYEKVRLALKQGEHKKPEFLAVNPNGKVPALVDGDLKLFESLAILLYLGEVYGEAKGLWPKAGTAERAEAYVWSVWGSVEVLPTVHGYAVNGTDVPFARPPEKRDKETALRSRAQWDELQVVLEKHLAGREYLLRSGFSLVDCATASTVIMAQNMIQLPVPPTVGAWAARCQARPAFARVMAQAFG